MSPRISCHEIGERDQMVDAWRCFGVFTALSAMSFGGECQRLEHEREVFPRKHRAKIERAARARKTRRGLL